MWNCSVWNEFFPSICECRCRNFCEKYVSPLSKRVFGKYEIRNNLEFTSWRMKDQLDVTCYFISLIMCSTEKTNLFRNNTQERQTHYFKRPLTPSPHIPHEQNSCASACKTKTTQNQPHQISNTQLTEVCTISNSYNKVHKLGTKYQTTNEKYHTQTNAIVTEHNRERSKSIKIHLPNTTRRQNTSH